MNVNCRLDNLKLEVPCLEGNQNMIIENKISIVMGMSNMLDYETVKKLMKDRKLSYEESGELN